MCGPVLRTFCILSASHNIGTIIHIWHIVNLRLGNLPQVTVPGGAELKIEPWKCDSRTHIT